MGELSLRDILFLVYSEGFEAGRKAMYNFTDIDEQLKSEFQKYYERITQTLTRS